MLINFRTFIKAVVLFLTRNLVVYCRNSTTQHGKFNCRTTNDENSTVVCKLYSSTDSILPIDDIPHNTTSLTIVTSGTGSLAINRADIFNRFRGLQNLKLRLYQSMQITPELLDWSPFESLKKQLFDVPKLNSLSIEYDEFNYKNYSWMLPVNLTRLFLSNGIFEFDLRNCTRLISLRLNRNKLSKIPLFHHPLPPLKVLHLRLNPLNEFMVNDVAGFTKLEYFAMDTANITNCECKSLKQWIVKLESWRNFTFEGDSNCNDSVDNYSNCIFDEIPGTENNTSSSIIFSKALFGLTGGFAIAVAVLCVIICCCCLLMMTCAAISNSFGEHGFGFSPFSPFSPFGMGGYGYGIPGMGYGMPGMGYGMPGMGYGMPGIGYGMPGPGIGMGMPGPGIGMGMPGAGPESWKNDRGSDRIENRDTGTGGRGGDDRYTGELDAPDNADNDEIFQVKICDESVF